MNRKKKSVAEGKAAAQLIRASEESALCNRGVAQAPWLLLTKHQLPPTHMPCVVALQTPSLAHSQTHIKNLSSIHLGIRIPLSGTLWLNTQRKSNSCQASIFYRDFPQSSILFCTRCVWKGWKVPGTAWSGSLLHSLQHQPRYLGFISPSSSGFHYILL